MFTIPLSQDEIIEASALRAEGKSLGYCARWFGVTPEELRTALEVNRRWTLQHQAQLVVLAKANLTAAEIGRRLGVTRNAVIGRCYRTGVQLNPLNESKSERISRGIAHREAA